MINQFSGHEQLASDWDVTATSLNSNIQVISVVNGNTHGFLTLVKQLGVCHKVLSNRKNFRETIQVILRFHRSWVRGHRTKGSHSSCR